VIAYLDSSVLLRVVLRQPDALAEWRRIERGVASALVEVECLRTLDRLRVAASLTDRELARRRQAVYRVLDATEIVEITRPVLARAAQPMPTALGTLDAIHLATALLWREWRGEDLVFATHDTALALAARASGVAVVGVPG
jgi:predicted nucleic acid-binding protein